MKTKNSIGIIDSGHTPDHILPQKIRLLQEYGADPDNAMLDCF